METSEVYFTSMHTELQDGLLDKFRRLMDAAGIGSIDMQKKFVAIKTHFGELGNLAFLRPNYSKVIADKISQMEGIPFLTDCSTLYVGKRKNAVEHLCTASLNGFNSVSAGCQIIIGDGLKGTNDIEIPFKGDHITTAKIGREIYDSDIMITLNHFKCHELMGFGGAVKNIGMGCASKRGKMELHSSGKPIVKEKRCRGCGRCLDICAHSAITVAEKAAIDHNICAGCGRCIGLCPFDAIAASMDEAAEVICRKVVEYAAAVLAGKPSFHMSVIADVSPFCDCHKENDLPIIPNVGMLASFDPVALDKACVDLSQKQPMIAGSRLYTNSNGIKPDDIFKCTHPDTRWQATFEHAIKMKLGSSRYELIEID
ncbi:MAG: DUF362 domain-containing protein [Candidatus Methanoplasma sp.]|jgi:uncharacterized Fe-S center protein|nr:DUF362 domain-containing protein [Candidatus Methanoplasma sp.]